jgi:hypothetical protein
VSDEQIAPIVEEIKKLRVSFADLPEKTAAKLRDEPENFKASDAKTTEYNMFSFGDLILSPEQLSQLECLDEYRDILRAVNDFSDVIKDYFNLGHTSEADYVQKPTKNLLDACATICFPGTSAHAMREYAYAGISHSRGRKLNIIGKIDTSIVFGEATDTSIYSNENKDMQTALGNKRMTETCATGICQGCFHMEASVQHLSERYCVTPPHFYGSLTTGKQWIFLSMNSIHSTPSFSRTTVIDTVIGTKGRAFVDMDANILVTKFLLHSMMSIKELLEINGKLLSTKIPSALSIESPGRMCKSSERAGDAEKAKDSSDKANQKEISSFRSSEIKSIGFMPRFHELTKENLETMNFRNRVW